jgi:predicted DCC family thiol-disulfide oxidoreductase YuxK
MGPHLIIYDGVCGLCNRLNQFVLKRDRSNKFRFAAVQSSLARQILTRYQKNPDDLNTMYLIADYEQASERILSKAQAALFILKEIGGVWKLSRVLNVVPSFLLNIGYDGIAKTRYRLFGKFDSCRMPDSKQREKFLGI